jgi:predicted ArsR family transcriptional regulator
MGLSSKSRSAIQPRAKKAGAGVPSAPWTFLTNHSHVLLTLSADPDLVMREVAARVGITERTVQKIVEDLEAAGVLVSERVGRRKRYRINPKAPLRHPVEAHRTVADIIQLVKKAAGR